MNPITGIIITLNEEKRIREAVLSLKKVCDEIIVVDSGSTDQTVQISESEGAVVHVQPYLGDGPQKNFGHRYAKNDWVFSLDADERLSEEAILAINDLDLGHTKYDGFAFRRRNYIGNRWIKVCGWYPDYLIRLYNHRNTGYTLANLHARVICEKRRRIKADIVHYSYSNSGELFSKAARFSAIGAEILYQKGRQAYFLSPFFHGLNAFVRKYLWQRGFVGGVDGFTVAMSAAVNSYLKYARLLEIQRDLTIRENLDKELW